MLAAAAVGRDALASGPIHVRMGVHTGEPTVTDEGYVGVEVHRAARICRSRSRWTDPGHPDDARPRGLRLVARSGRASAQDLEVVRDLVGSLH
jgi:hypothetical protein